MRERRRIVYVDLAPNAGGSLYSLLLLVQALDCDRYEPIVVLATGQPLAEDFRALGVRVLAVPVRAGVNTPGRDAPLVARARRGRLAGWLRQGQRRTAWLHGVGFVVKALPAVWAVARTLEGVLRRERPALVHLNDAVPVARPGVLAAWRARIPCLAHVRAFTPLNACDRWLARRVDGFVFISQAVADYQAGQGVQPRRSWVVPNGLDLAAFTDLPTPAEARQALGLPLAGPIVGAVGRLVAWKGHDVFLRALAILAADHPGLRGVVVGAPAAHDPRPLTELQSLAAELGIAERVHLAGHRADVPRVLPALDVLVHSAVEPEPFGRVIIEAMAAGVPVVAARAGGVPEIVEEGVNGLLVAPGDAVALARAVARLLAEPALAARLARAGRERVENGYTAQSTALAVQRAYEEMLCAC